MPGRTALLAGVAAGSEPSEFHVLAMDKILQNQKPATRSRVQGKIFLMGRGIK